MAWQQLQLTLERPQAELISEQLFDWGALSVTLQDARDEPILEPALDSTPLWQLTQLTALFAADTDLTAILSWAETAQQAGELAAYQLQQLADKNWVQESLRDWQPQAFGARLWICPSWQQVTTSNAVVVTLDPGLAFGTGTHPTTALCLAWLDNHLQPGQTVIDYGCGSGILAIAAKKLGAGDVWAVDHDPQALQATRANAARNQLTAAELPVYSPADFPAYQVDVLLANILAKPLIELAAYFATLLKPHGKLVVSGILPQQSDEVMAAYAPWFTLQAPVVQDGWVLLTADKLVSGLPTSE